MKVMTTPHRQRELVRLAIQGVLAFWATVAVLSPQAFPVSHAGLSAFRVGGRKLLR